MCTRVALHPHRGGGKNSQGWQGIMVLCLKGDTSHTNTSPQWVAIMVTHLQGGKYHHPWYKSPPPLSCITQQDMANFHHTTPLWKMPLYHRGWVLHNYSKPLVVIMVPNPALLVDTQPCQKPIIIPLRF